MHNLSSRCCCTCIVLCLNFAMDEDSYLNSISDRLYLYILVRSRAGSHCTVLVSQCTSTLLIQYMYKCIFAYYTYWINEYMDSRVDYTTGSNTIHLICPYMLQSSFVSLNIKTAASRCFNCIVLMGGATLGAIGVHTVFKIRFQMTRLVVAWSKAFA